MIHSWMLYSSAVALLLTIAAHLLEGVLRQRNVAIRPIWIAAAVGSLLLQTLALLSPAAVPAPALTGGAYVEAPASEAVAADATSAAMTAASESTTRRAERNVELDRWLLGAWGIASLLTLCGVAASAYLLRRRSREWVASQLDGHHVWISCDTGPAVIGFFRSRIVIPEWVVGQNEAERTMILAHEDEHVRARDPHLLLGSVILLIALPWNLALWWQAHRLRHAVEVDCDRRVLARGVDAQRYSRLLVAVSERGTAHRLMVAALAESPSALERRIRLMLRRPARRWMPRMLAGAVPAVLLVAVACEIPRPTMPAPQSTLEAAVGQGMVLVDRPEPMDILTAVMLEHFPEEYTRAGQGDTLYLWLIARADGTIERAALTEGPVVLTSAEQQISSVFPGAQTSGMYRSGAGTHFIAPGSGSPAVWPGGPEVLISRWWQRDASPGIDLDPHFMQSPEALTRQATVERLFPDLYENGIEDGSALWVAFDDSLRLHHAWIGPDFDERHSVLPSRDTVRQSQAVWDMVKAHIDEVIPEYKLQGVSRRSFVTRGGTPAPMVWIEQAPAAIELKWQ